MQIVAHFDGMTQLLDALSRHAREIPYATELAINATARTTKRATEVAMRHEFDRPTPFVMAGLFIDNARYRQNKLWAEVHVKDRGYGFTDTPLAEKIGQQFSGGVGRRRGNLEERLTDEGYIRPGEYVVAGPDAKLDRYGNLSRPQRNQISAALRLFRDVYQNSTNSRRSRRNARAAGRLFWSHGRGHSSHLRRGLWGTAPDGSLRLILVVVPKVAYRRRIDLDRLAEITVNRDFRRNFERGLAQAIAQAIATAR